MSGDCGVASVPEHEAGTEDPKPGEAQLTVGILHVYFKISFFCL